MVVARCQIEFGNPTVLRWGVWGAGRTIQNAHRFSNRGHGRRNLTIANVVMAAAIVTIVNVVMAAHR